MGIFKKQVKFVSAICPECKGHLELDSRLETAFCQYCGAQCIVENAPKRQKKQGKLETVLAFLERQQALRRQDKQEKLKRAEEEQRKMEEADNKKREFFIKYWWILFIIPILWALLVRIVEFIL